MHFVQRRNWDAISLQKLNFALNFLHLWYYFRPTTLLECRPRAARWRRRVHFGRCSNGRRWNFNYERATVLRYSESYLSNRQPLFTNVQNLTHPAKCPMFWSVELVTGPLHQGKSTLSVVHRVLLSVSALRSVGWYGSGRKRSWPNRCNILEFFPRDWGNTWKASIRMEVVPAGNRTAYHVGCI
jgi:hypothetical protein